MDITRNMNGVRALVVGTGLALCRAIAQRHGAQISATAVLGGGCTVRVQWPVNPAVATDES